MITFLICILIIASLCSYLFIVGANQNKTDYEKFFEDEEQMKYLSKNKIKN